MAQEDYKLAPGSRWEGRCVVDSSGTSSRIVYEVRGGAIYANSNQEGTYVTDALAMIDHEGLNETANQLRNELTELKDKFQKLSMERRSDGEGSV